MGDCFEFLDKYNSIVIFGNYRTGSTALCDILSNFIRAHGVKVFNWAEYLSTNLYLIDSPSGLQSAGMTGSYFPYGNGAIRVATRPIPMYIAESKLLFFNKIRKKDFVVFKIMPDDFQNGNSELITKHILHDKTIFKIGLTREDTDNLIISNTVCGLTGIWHQCINQEHTVLDIEKQIVPPNVIHEIVNNTVLHNTWLFYNHVFLKQIIWYDELHRLNIDELGLHNFSESLFLKNQISHRDRADQYFTDSEEFLECVAKLHKEIMPLVENVRKISTYKNLWKY